MLNACVVDNNRNPFVPWKYERVISNGMHCSSEVQTKVEIYESQVLKM